MGDQTISAVALDEYFIAWWLLGGYDRDEYRETVLEVLPTIRRERLAFAMNLVSKRVLDETGYKGGHLPPAPLT